MISDWTTVAGSTNNAFLGQCVYHVHHKFTAADHTPVAAQ